MGDENVLFLSQQLLEQNEDIIAAIVENMQLGRIDDCIKHYNVLHKNLVSMSLALDNFPSGNVKPYGKFPDEIMRKDILDELRPLGQTPLPVPPLPPPCLYCAGHKKSAHICRVELGHLEPAATFTDPESREFLKVSQLMEMRCRAHAKETGICLNPKGPSQSARSKGGAEGDGDPSAKGTRRTYRVWTAWERYTVSLGLATYGGTKSAKVNKIRSLLEGRNESQLRSYIAKNYTAEEMADLLAGKLPPCPPNYVPPKALAEYIALSNSRHRTQHILGTPAEDEDAIEMGATAAYSQLAPRQGRSDWTRLMGLVDEHAQSAEPDVRYDAMYGAQMGLGSPASKTYKGSGDAPSFSSRTSTESFYPPTTCMEGGGSLEMAGVQLPVIPSFTSIASAAPLHNPVRDAFDVLGRTAAMDQQQNVHPRGQPKKKRGQRASFPGDSESDRLGRFSSAHRSSVQIGDSHSTLIPFVDENSLAGHSLGPFVPSHHAVDSSQQLFGAFHDGDSNYFGGRREIMGDSLSQMSLDWGEGGGTNGWDGFSLHPTQVGSSTDAASVAFEGSINPSILRGGSKNVSQHKQKKQKVQVKKKTSKRKTSGSKTGQNQNDGTNRSDAVQESERSDKSLARAAVSTVAPTCTPAVGLTPSGDAAAYTVSVYGLPFGDAHEFAVAGQGAENSLLPVSDEFSMM